jgi:hypothetical protein
MSLLDFMALATGTDVVTKDLCNGCAIAKKRQRRAMDGGPACRKCDKSLYLCRLASGQTAPKGYPARPALLARELPVLCAI